ncbi:transposase [Streptomyces pilosus]
MIRSSRCPSLIDAQAVRTVDTVPAATRGFDAVKKVKGRQRFIVADTLGLLPAIHVVAASIQDRDGAKRPLLWIRSDHPGSGRSGPTRASPAAWSSGQPRTSAVTSRSSEGIPDQHGFQVQPKRWAVEPGTTRPAPLMRRR